MPNSEHRVAAPSDPALEPFRWCAAAAAHGQAGALAAAEALVEMTRRALGLYLRQFDVGWILAGVSAEALAGAWSAPSAAAEPLPKQSQTMETAMKISECMTQQVRVVDPDDTLATAAKVMANLDAGVLPVGENDRLVGMITDRDIAIRGVAEGQGPQAKVRDVMNREVKYCYEDQEVEDVLQNMGELQIRRMPVLNHDKRLVGIVSLGDLACNSERQWAGAALGDISRPGGQHSQTAH